MIEIIDTDGYTLIGKVAAQAIKDVMMSKQEYQAHLTFYNHTGINADPNIPYPELVNYYNWVQSERVRLGFDKKKRVKKLGKKAARKSKNT